MGTLALNGGGSNLQEETHENAPRHARLTGRDLVRLLQAAPHPDDAYLDAVGEAAQNQPPLPKSPWEQ